MSCEEENKRGARLCDRARTSGGEAIRRLVHPLTRSKETQLLLLDGDGGGRENRIEQNRSRVYRGRSEGVCDVRGEADPGRRRGLAIRGVVAGATYRKREVEDEDEEAVHSAAAARGSDAGRRVGSPSHAQNGRSPVSPARGATPPEPDGSGEVVEESERECVRAGPVSSSWS
jgi:hypothetical protein